MKTPVAASVGRAWMARVVIITAGVALGLVLGTGTARADSPLDLGKAADKVVSSVHKTTSSVTKKPTSKVRTVVKRATKPVRTVTKTVQRVTKPVHRATKPVQRAIKPVQRATKPVQRITKRVEHTKPVHKVTKPVQKVTKGVRPHRAAEPEPTATGQSPTTAPALSSTVKTGTALVGALTADVATGVVATDGTLTATTTPLVTGVTHQLPSSLRAVTDGVLQPVAAVHDTTLGLLDSTLVVTVPSVVDQVTTPLLPVLDQVENSLPGVPGVPGVPAVPMSPVVPVPPTTSFEAPPALTAPGLTGTAAVHDRRAVRTSDESATTTQLSDTMAPWLGAADAAEASAGAASVVAVAATVATLADDLLGGFGDTSVGVGPSGSATATALTLLLLALASSAGAFGAGARSLRVLGPLPQGPFRRAHRPGFSPD